jgi:hypothetical protein
MRTNNPWTRDDGVHGVGVVFQGFERQRQVILQRIKAVEDAVMKELLSKPALVSALFKNSQLADLGVQWHQIQRFIGSDGSTKDVGSIVEKLLLPLAGLVRMQLKLLAQRGLVN